MKKTFGKCIFGGKSHGKFAPEKRVVLAAIQNDQMTHKMSCNKNMKEKRKRQKIIVKNVENAIKIKQK